MTRPDFARLALDLLEHTVAAHQAITPAHRGLMSCGDDGMLDSVFTDLNEGQLASALEGLDRSIRIAIEPPAPPTEGRNRLERHQQAIELRAHFLNVAQICRVLVLDAIKAGGAA